MNAKNVFQHALAKPVLFCICLLPFAYLSALAVGDGLGANPAEALIRSLGDWTLRFLCITLAITPLRRATGLNALLKFRRMLGLFTFFYGVLHLLAYAWFDMGLDVNDILRDIAKRPFILVGSLALLLMTPLAATSFNAAIKALGAARWQLLHRLVYAVAVFGLVHFWWMRAGKQNFTEPAIYIAIVLLLFSARIWHFVRQRAANRSAAQRANRQ